MRYVTLSPIKVQPATQQPKVHFGPYTLDLKAGELRKHGVRLGLEMQPFQVLCALVERSGEVVTRDELRNVLWPGTVAIDSDGALSTAIRKIRAVLLDSADQPKYVETLPKRGYRFIAAIEYPVHQPESTLNTVATPLSAPLSLPQRSARNPWMQRAILLACGLLAAVGLFFWRTSNRPAPRVLRYVQLTSDGLAKGSDLVTDGGWLYFNEDFNDASTIVQLSASGGHPYPVSHGWTTRAISPAGNELLVFPSAPTTEAERPLSAIDLPGGTPFDLGIRGHAGAWSPDGEKLVYAAGDSLFLAARNGSQSRRLASARGWMGEPTWSPDGSRIWFCVANRAGQRSLEEVSADGRSRRTIAGPSPGLEDYRGSWTPDGRYYVFERMSAKVSNLWAVRESRGISGGVTHEVFQLTDGPVSYTRPVVSRDGGRVIAFGMVIHTVLMRYQPGQHQFRPYLPGLSADNLAYSPDGEQIAWVQVSDRTLWRSRADGSGRRQLNQGPMEAEMPRWSPDGKSIAFAGRREETGRIRLYSVPSNGGKAEEMVAGDSDQANPNWSPDGMSLIYGGAPWRHGFAPGSSDIRRVDLRTRRVSTLPGSEGLWAPKWSPDGRFLAVETLDSRGLKLYDFQSGAWSDLARTDSVIGYPCWSRDSQSVYFNTSGNQAEPAAVYRVRLNGRRLDLVTRLKEFSLGGSLWQWFGLAPDDSLLVQRDATIQEVYSIEMNFP